MSALSALAALAAAPPPDASAPSFEIGDESKWGDSEVGLSSEKKPEKKPDDAIESVALAMNKATVVSTETLVTASGVSISIERAAGSEELRAATTWEELDLHPGLLKGVYLAHFDRPFKIQEAAIPLILSGHRASPHRHCLLAQAKSGSGKTAAFALGMLQNIDLNRKETQAVCVCPTRELTLQNYEFVRKVGKVMIEENGLGVHVAVKEERPETGGRGSRSGRGGSNRSINSRELVTAQVIVGTPGKLLSMLRAKTLNPRAVTMFVLDEADVMDQGGGRDDTRSIRQALPEDTQVLCFSATYTDSVVKDIEQTLFKRHANSKVRIAEADSDENRSGLMVHEIAHVWCEASEHPQSKLGIVEDIFDMLSAQQSIIFVNTRNEVKSIAEMLRSKSFSVSDLSGSLTVAERDAVMKSFRDGKVKVLITTNVLSRGIDVPGVNIVINYDLPLLDGGRSSSGPAKADTDTYIHRVGRSGRAGARGVAINLVDNDATRGQDLKILAQIETKCFGAQAVQWSKIQKVPDASDVESIKEIAKKHLGA